MSVGEYGETIELASDRLSARVAIIGAELQDLRDARGLRLQWDGDPAVWSGRAPILFPIVGALAGGRYRLDGRTFEMGRHGFARHAIFDVVSHDAGTALLRLHADDRTLAAYPFHFRLDVAFALVGTTLRVTATVANLDDGPMPVSFGFHPAFAWPLPYGEARDDHAIRFACDEPAPVRRIDGDGLLLVDPQPTPVDGDTLHLRDALFADDAMILDHPASREVVYGAPQGPRLRIAFDGFTSLGLWSKPGAGFVCIEPWQGHADPVGFNGDFRSKPGIVLVAPGASRVWSMTISLERESGS